MMILYPGNPEMYKKNDFSGTLGIPDKLSLPEETETEGEVDAFVQALIECMSKAIEGR